MIHNLFSTPIYKVNILDSLTEVDLIENIIRKKFIDSSEELSSLEKNGGVSTYETDNQLHNIEILEKLNDLVLLHCKMYWRVLEVDERLSPRIDQCWSNIHKSKSFTLQHSHSLMPMVAAFYLRAELNSGDLILTNPAEYSITNIPFSQSIERKIETAIKIKTGDLIIFPGYIRHKTGENFSTSDRIVISYNIGYSGKYLSSSTEYPNLDKDSYCISDIDHLQNKILNLEFVIENLKRNIINEK